jgi:hypothetical protein
MYQARFTETGAERFGMSRDCVIEYDTIHQLGEGISGYWINGVRYESSLSLVGEDRSIDLITWPNDLDYTQGG